jgi:rRNA maturation RNase YbeY
MKTFTTPGRKEGKTRGGGNGRGNSTIRVDGRLMPLAERKRLVRLLGQALGIIGVMGGEWTISLVDDAAMMELHGRTMKLPTTTDVLTFDLRDSSAPGFDGARRGEEKVSERRKKTAHIADPRLSRGLTVELDTVICMDEARRRARELGHPVFHEVLLYAVHSVLHVTGYDDRAPATFRAMHRREDEILAALGIGPVFEKRRGSQA